MSNLQKILKWTTFKKSSNERSSEKKNLQRNDLQKSQNARDGPKQLSPRVQRKRWSAGSKEENDGIGIINDFIIFRARNEVTLRPFSSGRSDGTARGLVSFTEVGLGLNLGSGYFRAASGFFKLLRVLSGFFMFLRFLRALSGFCRFFWAPSGFFRFLRDPSGFIEILGFLRISLGFFGILRVSLDFSGILRAPLDFIGLPRIPLGLFRFLRAFLRVSLGLSGIF